MNQYQIRIVINVKADDKDHAYEQVLDQLTDGQFTPEIVEV